MEDGQKNLAGIFSMFHQMQGLHFSLYCYYLALSTHKLKLKLHGITVIYVQPKTNFIPFHVKLNVKQHKMRWLMEEHVKPASERREIAGKTQRKLSQGLQAQLSNKMLKPPNSFGDTQKERFKVSKASKKLFYTKG